MRTGSVFHCQQYDQCFRRCADALLKRIASPGQQKAIMDEINPLLEQFNHSLTPPALLRMCFRHIREKTGIADPYREIKDQSIACARKLLLRLRPEYSAAADPFALALRWAIAGNIIDYGAVPDLTLDYAEKLILKSGNAPLENESPLRERAERAESILYILDNCGESVLDALLLEQLAGKVTVAVRGKAILNDVTRREAETSGLGAYPLVDTGDDTPGISLPDSGEAFRKAYAAADLVICKGLGNFETMTGLGMKDTFFLFLAKCPVVADFLNVPQYSLQLLYEEQSRG